MHQKNVIKVVQEDKNAFGFRTNLMKGFDPLHMLTSIFYLFVQFFFIYFEFVCVCVCVCVCVGHVYVVYEDTNLYNDMGMTQVLQGEVIYEDIFSVPII